MSSALPPRTDIAAPSGMLGDHPPARRFDLDAHRLAAAILRDDGHGDRRGHSRTDAVAAGTSPAMTDTMVCAFALRRFLEQLPADQHAPDFAGAGADLVKLGIAQQPPRGIVVDIAVAAEQLDGVKRTLRRLLGGIENGAGRILAGGLAAIAGFRHR